MDSATPQKTSAPQQTVGQAVNAAMQHNNQEAEAIKKPSWKIRHRVIVLSLLFCAAVWIYVLGAPIWSIILTERIAETALEMTAFLAGSVIGGYVFGAAWENLGVLNTLKK